MYINKLRLGNFRNFELVEWEFDQGTIALLGPNGSGKSNLIESLCLMAQGDSFRTITNRDLIRLGEKAAVIEVEVSGDERTDCLRLEIRPGSRRFYLNGKTVNHQEIDGKLKVVAFVPRHLNILIDGPKLRRDFLDELLKELVSEYADWRSRYLRVLRQRNSLLDQPVADRAEFMYWNRELIALGSLILRERKRLVEVLNDGLANWRMEMVYRPSPRVIQRELGQGGWELAAVERLLSEKLKEVFAKEQKLGFTLIGPQRDDWELYGVVDDQGQLRELPRFASRGQQRLAIVRLKSLQLNLVKEDLSRKPIFLLDDVLSELDAVAQREVKKLVPVQQTVITAVEEVDMACGKNIVDLGKGRS